MPTIIPIRDLAKTAQISEMCHESKEPIFVTKNGYADLVVMSASAYELQQAKYEMYQAIIDGREDELNGRVRDGFDAMNELGAKYGLRKI